MSIRCPKPDCGETFATDKARKKHCDELEDHDYCKKCDYLAKDWDDLTHHKATSPIVHLCCKFCGQDFKTPSGRDRHIKTIHPIDQDIRCVGCNEHFVRASALVEHLESDHCRKISAQQFMSSVRHKHMLAKILDGPDAMSSKLSDLNVNNTSTQGGIALSESSNLLNEEHESNSRSGSLQHGGSIMQPCDPNTPRLGERWPSLPSHRSMNSSSTPEISSGMAGISISGGSSGGARLPSSAMHSMGSPPSALPASTVKASESQTLTAASGASSKLFPGAEPTPVSPYWEAALEARDLEYEAANPTNMLIQRFWDPTHKDYNPERFFNPVIEMYSCPFSRCDQTFYEPIMLESHINTAHALPQPRCPKCLKLFKSYSALVAHYEAPASGCGISQTEGYDHVIDQSTGGFLMSKEEWHPSFSEAEREDKYTNKKMVQKTIGTGHNIQTTRYESTFPLEWPSDALRNHVQIGRFWNESGRTPSIYRSTSPSFPLSKPREERSSATATAVQPFVGRALETTSKRSPPLREQRNSEA